MASRRVTKAGDSIIMNLEIDSSLGDEERGYGEITPEVRDAEVFSCIKSQGMDD